MALGSGQVVARAVGVLDMDTTGWKKGLNDADRQIQGAGKTWKSSITKVSRTAALAGGAALAVGLKASVGAAMEAQKSQAAMETQLKASGVAYEAHAKQIDKVIQAQSKMAAVDDEEVQGAFTNLVRATGDVNKALKLNEVALDLSRARGIDAAKAAELVGKVANGNTGALSRYGITLKEGATAQEAIAELQKRFSGQAEAYGKTAAGAADRSKIAYENLGESIGSILLPIMTKVSTAFGKVAEWAEKNRGIFLGLVGAIGGLVIIGSVLGYIASFMTTLKTLQVMLAGTRLAFLSTWAAALGPIALVVAALALVGAAFVILWKKSETFRDIVHAVWDAVKAGAQAFANFFTKTIPAAFEKVLGWVKAHWPLIVAIIMGPIGLIAFAVYKFRDNLKAAFKVVVDAMTRAAGWIKDKASQVVEFVKGIPGKIGNVGVAIWGKLKQGWDAVGQWVRTKIGDFVGWLKGIPGKLGDIGGSIFRAIVGGFKSAWNTAARLINKIPNIDVGPVHIGIPDLPILAQRGGRVPGVGSSDSVPALLTPGEAVLNSAQIARVGGPAALKAAGVPGFAQGGLVLPGTSRDYTPATALNDRQIADLVYRYGWENRNRQEEATRVVLGESSGRWGAHYTGGGKEDSWGGWQINRRAHPQVSVLRAKDPEGSSTYARGLYHARGWQPWGAWTDGRASKFATRAANAVTWHRKALAKAKADKGGKQNPTQAGPKAGSGGGGKPAAVSATVAPPVTGPLVSAVPGWPGSSTNWRTYYGTYYQEDRGGRYVAFQPTAQSYWRVGMPMPGPLTNVPDPLLDEPGPHIGPLGEAAVGHPFAFPQFKRWWGRDTYKPFTDMAAGRGWTPKQLREWAHSEQAAAALIGFTPYNLPEGNRWPGQGKASDATGNKGKGKDAKGKPDKPKGDNARAWERVKKAIAEVNFIDRLNLPYTYGGGHHGGVPARGGPFDCSAFVSRILMASGIIKPRASYVSGDFLAGAGAGMKGGGGKWLTVWVRHGIGRSGHVFLGFPGGRQAESGGYGAGGSWMHRSTSGFSASHPVGYARGGVVGGRGRGDTVPALLTPGELVLNERQQGRLAGLVGSPMGKLLGRLGVPRARGRLPVRATTGAKLHFHWFGAEWSRGQKQAFLDRAKKSGVSGDKLLADHPFMGQVFAGTATEGGPVHGPNVGGGGGGAPAAPAPAAPGPAEDYLPPPEPEPGDGGGGDGGGVGDGGGPSGPTAAEIEAQVQERLKREAEAIWGARSGFISNLAPNIFGFSPGGLTLGSDPLGAGRQPVIMNNSFSQVPDDPFVWLRRTETAARFAMG